MIDLPWLLMLLSIILFCGAALAALTVFFNKLGYTPIKLPLLRLNLPKVPCDKKVYYEIALCCISSRIVIYIIGALGYMLVKNQPINLLSSFSTLFNKWDGAHYTFLAENWYVNYGDKKNLLVFFPLYPIAIKALSLITFNYQIAGVLVSNISLIIGCIYLYKITEMDFGSDIAFRAVKYLLLFPVSFFLGITYGESMFFALSVVTLFYWRKKSYKTSSILAFLAALTRSFGLLLVIPMLTDLIIEYKNKGKLINKNELWGRFSTILSPFLGISTYLLINLQVSGNALTFLKYQKEHWHQSLGFFGSTVKMLTKNSLEAQPAESASLWVPQLILIFIALLLLCYGIKHLNISYVTYMIGYIFLTISPTWLLSAPRYLMCLFPLFILLGYIGKKSDLDFAITILMATSLGFCTIAFVNGYYIM